MLSEIQKNGFSERAKAEAKRLLDELRIKVLDDDSICNLQKELDLRIASLVSAQENGEVIDMELLDTYDLLSDIVLDHENDTAFLNALFF